MLRPVLLVLFSTLMVSSSPVQAEAPKSGPVYLSCLYKAQAAKFGAMSASESLAETLAVWSLTGLGHREWVLVGREMAALYSPVVVYEAVLDDCSTDVNIKQELHA